MYQQIQYGLLGFILLMIAAAAMKEKQSDALKSITLFAAEVDFKDAGELLLFMDDSQISFLEDIMWEKGYLDGKQMAGTFSMLRSIDLIWSRVIKSYLLGQGESINDLMAWDYDTTRLPYRMHSEYLRKLFHDNELVQGKFKVDNKKIALVDIRTPLFVVSTQTDHVAPWKSVYKIHLYTKTDITFVLTNGGHNAGIVSEPNHPGRHFQMHTHHPDERYLTTERWLETAQNYQGSWWPQWHEWLQNQSSLEISAPTMGNVAAGLSPLCDAPGTYVLDK